MKKIARLVCTVIACFLLTTPGVFAVVSLEVEEEISTELLDRFMNGLMGEHPRAEVREQLRGWLESEEVLLFYDKNLPSWEIEVGLKGEKSKLKPAIFVNPLFLLTYRSDLGREMSLKYKYIALLHVHVYIEGHKNGTMPLRQTKLADGETAQERAEYVWHLELKATRSEWAFAREMQCEYLVSRVQAAVAKYGEELGLVEALNSMIQDPAYYIPSPLVRAELRKIYEREKAKLSSISNN